MTTHIKMTSRQIPALRGVFGTWVYYSSMVRLGDVVRYVKTADEIHKSEKLSQMIQRELKDARARDISQYLCDQDERFLNSLVVAVYGGTPQWFPLGRITRSPEGLQTEQIGTDDLATIGFLSLSGQERFFALDGQHRLAGIRLAIKQCRDRADDEINVLFVAHSETPAGRQRTRRLFTTLNKRAKAVAKGAIIALDEDDAMAIVCRRLVEEHAWFTGSRIAYQATNNMPTGNTEAFTTLGALYDTLGALFCGVYGGDSEKLRFYRPSDPEMEGWYKRAEEFFGLCHKHFASFRRFCEAGDDFGAVTTAQRNKRGGSVLFRPIGLIMLAEVLAALTRRHKKSNIGDIFSHVAGIPWRLSKPPFAGVIWDSRAERMVTGTRVLCRDLVLFVLGEDLPRRKLASKYAKAKGLSVSDAETYLDGLSRVNAIGG